MLGIGMAALTRQPCNCAASDETIRKPWDPDQEPEQQQHFENPEDCFWRSVYGEHHNDWYTVKIKSVGKDDKAIETNIVYKTPSKLSRKLWSKGVQAQFMMFKLF